jgi:aminomethyltransferase
VTATTPTVIEGYHVIRQQCALVSHDSTIVARVSGPGATALLSGLCSRSVDFLLEGQILSALLVDDSGNLVAELLVHCLGGEFLLQIAGSRAAGAVDLLRAAGHDARVEVVDDVRVIGLEGPDSPAVAQRFLSLRVDAMAYPSFTLETFRGAPLLVSRTGVSGEYGFTFHVTAAAADALIAQLQEAGAVPVDHASLEICRLEMRFPNLDLEAPEADATPFTVGLQWMVDFGHEFPGKLALLDRAQNERTSTLVCWRGEGTMDVPAAGTPLSASGTEIGQVRHALYSPGLDSVIGVADVAAELAASGLDLALDGSGPAVRTVSAPFRKATSLGRPMIQSGSGTGEA